MEFIDGNPVVAHRARFQNQFPVHDEDEAAVRDGETVVWIVRARCLPPQYFPASKDGLDRYRLSIQKVEEAVPLGPDLRDQALAYLSGGLDQTYLSPRPEGFELRLPFEGFGEPVSDDIAPLRGKETL